MNLYLLAIVAAIAFGAGWQTRAWKAGADDADRLGLAAKDTMRRAERVDVKSEAYETKRAATQQAQRVITREVERVIQADPVYLDRCLSDDGLRAVAAAIAGSAPAGGVAPALPAADASR